MDRSDDELPDWLAMRLKGRLPGAAAQRIAAPQLAYGRHHGPPAHDARPAAVMVLLYRHECAWYLPMTLRPQHLPDHPGQVSFPGGMAELGEGAEQCAVRELEEELGVPAEALQLLGRLSDVYVFASNFAVTPIVAVADRRPDFRPSSDEVARILEVPIATLMTSANRGGHEIVRRGLRFQAPHVAHGGERIWGATYLILAELMAIIREHAAVRAARRTGTQA